MRWEEERGARFRPGAEAEIRRQLEGVDESVLAWSSRCEILRTAVERQRVDNRCICGGLH